MEESLGSSFAPLVEQLIIYGSLPIPVDTEGQYGRSRRMRTCRSCQESVRHQGARVC